MSDPIDAKTFRARLDAVTRINTEEPEIRFKQILVLAGRLYGLDGDGQIWLNTDQYGWMRCSQRKAPPAPPF